MTDEPIELNLAEVVEVEPDQLSEEQKAFLEDNKDDLSDEQADRFGIKREPAEPEEPEEPRIRPTSTPKPKVDEEEDEIDPDDEKRIGRVVEERLKQAGVGDTRDQLEVDAVIRERPELSPYRDRALKYMKAHPTLVAQDAVSIVSYKDAQELGAKKEREAAEKVRETQSPGESFRKPTGGGVDWTKASAEDVEAQREKLLRGN